MLVVLLYLNTWPDFFSNHANLRGQASNFCIELVQLCFVTGFERCQRLFFLKETWQTLYGSTLPLVQLCGMDLIL